MNLLDFRGPVARDKDFFLNSPPFSYIFILGVYFKNLTIRLYVLIIFFILVKFEKIQKSIVISSNKC